MLEPEFETESKVTIHNYLLTSTGRASLQCLASASKNWGAEKREAVNLT